MQVTNCKTWISIVGAIAGIVVFLSAGAAPPHPQALQPAVQELVFSVDATQSKIHYAVDTTLHTVHGTFNLKNGAIRMDSGSGKASGEIIVYVTSGDSGNSSRDEKMHKEVLESTKYPDLTFRPKQVDGKVALSGPSDVKIQGILSLHGGEHDLTVPVHAEINGDRWKGNAKFRVPFIQWGLKDPSSFLLKVKPNVDIELELSGSWKPSTQ
jgi:polyisoprenoid-binding protein YceI